MKKNNRRTVAPDELTVLCIGDNHLPYLHKPTFTWIIDEILPGISAGPRKRGLVVLDMGDKRDQYAQKKFPGKMIGPQDEFNLATQMGSEMWRIIKKRAPDAKLIQLRGNHDARAEKRLLEKCPEVLPLYQERGDAYKFDGVETIPASEHCIIGETEYTHGHRSKLVSHLIDVQYQRNIVIGHLHTAEQVYHRVGTQNGKIRFAACTGYLADPWAVGLNYRPKEAYFKWTHGCLIVENQWPKFIGVPAKLQD